MAGEKAKLFFEKLNTDPEAQALLKESAKPEKPEEALKAYVELAGKLDISLTEEELNAYLEEEKKVRKNRTEAASAQIAALPDEVLDAVAGGGFGGGERNLECHRTYRNRENCWFNDGCDNVYHMYDDYICAWYYYLEGEK